MESATGIRSAVGWRKVEDVVELMEAELILGNGSVQAGRGLMAALAKRMGEAREKHPWPEHADGKYQALGVVGEEYHELVIAVEKETPERMRDEALDVAVTALRMWAGEHERRGGVSAFDNENRPGRPAKVSLLSVVRTGMRCGVTVRISSGT